MEIKKRKMIKVTKLRLKISVIMMFFVGVVVSSCSKMDGTYKEFLEGGEIRYSQKPDTLGIKPGHNRVEAWLAAKRNNVSKFKIYWNDRLDSIEVPVTDAFDTDTLRVIIDNMEEGSYTFEFFTFDREGNTSIVVDTVGEVFGDTYVASLSNRLVRTSGLVHNNIRIEWFEPANEQVVGTEVRYKDQAGLERLYRVAPEEEVSRINDRPLDDVVQYRTLFLPHPHSIDTFYTEEYTVLELEVAQSAELDKEKFVEYTLPSDAPISPHARSMADLWDGLATDTRFYGVNANSGTPHWFTFDMGTEAILSRLTHYQRSVASENLLFNSANVRVFEVWGSNDPNPDGSWDDSWIKLMEGVSQKPSGLPRGQLNDDDRAQAANGEDFIFPEDTPPVRYIRVKVFDTWNPGDRHRSFIAEWTLHGITY